MRIRTFGLVVGIFVSCGAVTPQSGPNAQTQEQSAKAAPPNCSAVCYTYRELVKAERDKALADGYQYYLVTATDQLLRLKVRSDLTTFPPVDDLLYVQDNGTDLWRYQYPRTDAATFTLAADQLSPGANTIILWYENLYPPNAHFFADVCGLGAACETYKEGLTFGTGIVNRAVANGFPNRERTVVRQSAIWRSKIDDPNAATGCACPIPNDEERLKEYQNTMAESIKNHKKFPAEPPTRSEKQQ